MRSWKGRSTSWRGWPPPTKPMICAWRSKAAVRALRYEAMHPFELTRRLIEIESITENEKSVALFLRDYLRGLSYDVSLQEAAPERFNVLAFAGKPELVFATHIDTVPPYLPFHEDEEYLYGRGACDAKGIVAAQIAAAERLRAEGSKHIEIGRAS